ncbi:hypothetical protein D3C72_1971020 [compost metagenome]
MYGPVPIRPSPLFNSMVVLPSAAGPDAAFLDMMGNCARFTRRFGATLLVVIRTVIGSTASVFSTDPRYRVNGDGLLGTLGTRS